MTRSGLLLRSAAGGGVLLLAAHLSWSSATTGVAASETHAAADSVAAGVFEGRTPCSTIANDFTGFPSATCEKVKWEITLFRDGASGAPRSYLYRGTRTSRSGRWSTRRGAAHDPAAIVHQLHYGSDQVLSLLSVDDRVLLLLDADLRALVGDASWSYVLNRTDRR